MKLARRFWLDFLASLKAILFPTSRLKRLVGTRRPRASPPKRWRPRLGSTRSLACQPLEPKLLLTSVTIQEMANANGQSQQHGTFDVMASPTSMQALTVTYTVGGSAVANDTYHALSGTLTIGAGQMMGTIDVSPILSSDNGTNPSVIVTLNTGQGYTLSSPSSATVTITEPSAFPTVSGVSPAAGPTSGGGGITISGGNFNGVTGVKIGSAPATSYTVTSSSSINAVLPAESAGVVNVTVTTSGGTSATGSQDQFTFQAAPTVSGVSPASGPISGGGTITISGSNFNGVTGVSVGGTAATSYTVNSSSSISAVLPAESAGVANVTITTAGGTSATGSQDQFTFQAAPVVSGVSPGSGVTTGGTQVTISGQNFANVTAVDFGTGSGALPASSYTVTSSGVISAVAPAESAGVVDVTVTTSGGTSATGSQDHFNYTPPVPSMRLLDGASTLSNGGSDEFGGTTTGSPVTKTFTVSNASGTGPLIVSSLTLPAGFTSSGVFPLDVAAGGSAQLNVTMSASAAGEAAGQMVLDDNDPANTTYTVSLDGQVLYPISSVTIAAMTTMATEMGGADGQFQISRSGGDVSQPLTVLISTSGSAVSGSDYVPLASTVTIPVGALSTVIDVVPLAGAGTQSVIVLIDPSPSYIVGGAASALVWVAPPYVPPISGGPTGSPSAGTQMVTVGATQPTALEETGVAGQFTLYRAAGDTTTLQQAADVELSLAGTAVVNVDYALTGVSVANATTAYAVIPAGQHTLTIGVAPIDDGLAGDPNKTVQLSLVPGTNDGSTVYAAPLPSATVTIVDADPPDVSIVATQPNADEESGATGTLTVTRDGPTTAPLTVSYSVGGGAVNGTDLQSLPGSLTIPAGAASATITVVPIDDGLVNPARWEIVLPAATGGTFTLTVGGATTTPLAYNAGAAAVQDAISALASVGAGNAVVTGIGMPLVPFVVAFKGALLHGAVPALTADGSQLTGTPTIGIGMTVPGGAPSGGTQRIGIFGQRPPGTGLGNGQFIVIFAGNSTAPLSFSSSAGAVQNALAGLAGIGAGNVSVTQDAQSDQISTFQVQFTGSLSGQNVAPLSVVTLPPANDSPDSIWPTPAGIQQSLGGGSSGANAVQTVTVAGASGGTFTLGFRSFTTSPIAWNSSAGVVAAALEALPSIGQGNVAVAGSPGGAWQVTFQNALGARSVPMLADDPSRLSNGPIVVSALPALSPAVDAVFTLVPHPGVYNITAPGAATVVIADSDPHLTVSSDGTPLANGDGVVDFGGTQIGQPVDEQISLASGGDVPLTLVPSSLVLPAGFELVGGFPTTIAVGATSYFELELTAEAPGAYGGTVSFMTSDVDDAAPFRFNVTGEVTPSATVSGVSPDAGPISGGTTVTITGADFTNDAIVFFGGAPASSYTVRSSTTIVATSPPEAAGLSATVDVTVVAGGSTSATSPADQFTYQAAPAVSGVAAASGPLAGGTSITISGSGFADVTVVDVGGVAASSFTATSATTIVAVTPADTTSYGTTATVDVTVTTIGGASPAVAADQFTYQAAPLVTAVSPGSGPTSGGTWITITGENFANVTAVDFGAVAAIQFDVMGPGEITALDPAGSAGIVVVTVTNTGGTSPSGDSSFDTVDQFTYQAAPTVSSVSPDSGPLAGGTWITIDGENFSNVTAVDFGTDSDAMPALDYEVLGPTQIAALTPAGSASTVDVTVTNTGGTSATTLADQFTYQAAPSVSGVSPGTGPAAGGTPVTITGQEFGNVTGVYFGGVAAATYTVLSSTSIVATAPPYDLSGAELAATVDVIVANTGGVSAARAVDEFTFQAAPIVSEVSPASGPTSGGTQVTITGENFANVAAVSFGGAAAASFAVLSPTTIVAVSPAGAAATVDVTVATLGGTSATSAVSGSNADQFTYQAAPAVSGVSPASGPTSGGTTVTITGQNFGNVTAVDLGGTAASAFTVQSATTIVAVTPDETAGVVDVTVTNTGGTSATSNSDEFTYQTAPSVSGVSPASGPLAGGTLVTITGEEFANVTAVDFGTGSAAVAAASFSVLSATEVAAVSPAGTATVDVTVTNTGGTSATSSADQFTFLDIPAVSGVTPASGSTVGGSTVTITGVDFSDATAVDFGAVAASSFTVQSATTIVAVTPAESASTVDVTVTNGAGTSATGASDRFTFVPAPQVSGVSPGSGPTSGGTTVTITGGNFTGASAVDFGTGSGAVPASSFTVQSATTIVAVSPPGSAATVDVIVTSASGASVANTADQFTYQAAPTVSGVSPGSGSTAGGTSVTITGQNFANVTAVDFGAVAAASFTRLSATTIVAAAPAESAATVDVTVVNTGGTSAISSADHFTYLGVPAVRGVSPGSGPTSGGTTVTITGGNFTGATAVDFGGTAAASYTVQSSTTIVAVSPAGSAGTVDVTVTNADGTSAAVSADQFTFQAAPTVSGVSPASGPLAGGTTVTITGQNFNNVTAVDFGGVAATYSRLSATSIVATDPNESAATVDVTVTNTGGTSAVSASDQFTYQAAPTVSGVSPASGPLAGATTVTITGQNFNNVTAVDFGGVAATFTRLSATSIVATDPAESAATVDVTVTNTGGTSPTSTSDQFTYQTAPTVSAVSPASGPLGGGTTVTITGQNFNNVIAVDFGAVAATFTRLSATSIAATDPAESAATVDVTVTNTGGTSPTSTSDQFTYQTAPTVSAVSPASGPLGGGTTVTITGQNFNNVTAVDFGTGSGAVAAATYTRLSATSILATDPAESAATIDVTVTNTGGTSAVSVSDQFTYQAAPTVSVVSLASGPLAGGTTVTITGQNFNYVTAVDFGGAAASDVTVQSSTTIVAVAPPEAGTAGSSTVDITVSNSGGTSAKSAADQFTYQAAPTVSGVLPGSGPLAGGTTVTITGQDFSNVSAVDFGAVSATTFTRISATSIVAVDPAAGASTVDVTVVNTGGVSATSSADQFTYQPAPIVTAVSPAFGSTFGGASITITGQNFAHVTAVDFGTGSAAPATTYTVVSPTTIVAVAPAESAATVNVTVVNSGGTSAVTAADQFTFVAIPQVSGVTPGSGPTAGGTLVTIIGANLSSATVVDIGGVAASSFSILSAGLIVATTPAEAAPSTGAVVDVTVANANGVSATTSADQYTYQPAPSVSGVTPAAGSTFGGTQVTIRGQNFANLTGVYFGAVVAASYTVVSRDTIVAMTPAGPAAGAVDVTVTNTGGTSPTSTADQFTYRDVPAVTGVSPASGLTAGGESVTITGGNFTGAMAVDFGTGPGAVPATSFTITSATTIVATAPPYSLTSPQTAAVLDVTVVNANGVSATTAADQFTYSDAPVVRGVAPDFGPTSGGTSITITGQNFAGATAVDFGAGSGADPATSFTVTSPTTIVAVVPAGTAATVDVTVTTPDGGVSATGSADQFTYIASANPIHVANFGLVDDTGVSNSDLLTYDPRVTGAVAGSFLAARDQAIVQFDDLGHGQVSGSTSAISVAGTTFVYDPSADDPALAGYAGSFTLHYRVVESDAHGNVISTGAWTSFTMTLYAAKPTVSVTGLQLVDDTDPTNLALATSDPRVTGAVMAVTGAMPAGGAIVEFSHHGNGTVDGQVPVTQTNPMFTYDPRVSKPALNSFVGMLDLAYRTVQYDAAGYAIESPWTNYPFLLEQAASPAVISALQLAHVTGAAGPPPVTSDPTVTGRVTGATSSAVTIQFEYNADTVPDASITALPNGSFSYALPNLVYGVVTVHARAVQLSMQGGFEQYGAWTSITFDYEPPPAPTIADFALTDATGAPANPSQTTNPTVTGQITGATAGQAVDVEFDTNGDGIADAQVAASGNSFTFTPSGLDPGAITIAAHTVVHQPNSNQLSYSAWTPLTFTYLATASAPPAIENLQLASLAGTTTVGTTTSDPVVADPTLSGQVYSGQNGVDFQTVQFNYDGDGSPDASTTTDAQGNFTFTPTGLSAGPVTISVRAEVWDTASNADLYGPWSTISFTYQPPTTDPVVVSSFSLLNNTGTAAAPEATDPTVVGQLAENPSSSPATSVAYLPVAYLTVQFEFNGDGNVDGSVVADANGAFQYTPAGLPYGNVTIAARPVTHDTAAGGFYYGSWAPLTFDYVQTVLAAPAIDSFALASVTDSPTSGGTPVTANPTVKGHVDYQGDPTQLVIELTDPGEASALGPGAGIDAAGYATVIPDAQGNFVFTPEYLSHGAVTIKARIQSYYDPASQTVVAGAWSSLSFTYETQTRSAPAIATLGLLDSSGAVTAETTSDVAQPALGGTVSYQGDLAGITVQYSLDGGETTAGSVTTDDYGNFSFSPAGLTAGNITIDVRTQVFDDVGNQLLTGAWTPFTFAYQPPAAPSLAIGTFAVATSSVDAQGNLTASDPTVTGSATGVADLSALVVQFDTNGDGTPDGSTTTDSSGNFIFTPTGLTAGPVTIAARAVDTAADGTSVYSSWTSLSFTYAPAGSGVPVISQLVLADDNGASSTDLSTSDPTVKGLVTLPGSASPAAPAAGVVVDFDTNGDGVPDGSATTNSHGQFTYTPYVDYGLVTVAASIVTTASDGTSTLGPWMKFSFEYASNPDSAAAQAAAAALAANGAGAAQATHDGAVASAAAQSQSALDTASANYRSATNGATVTGGAATAAATAAYSSQTASANAAYNASVVSAGQAFTTAVQSFHGDSASYEMPSFTWPAAPPEPAGPTDAKPTPPVQAPTYSGPTYDVTADPGYQADVATAQAGYNGSVEGASTTYEAAVEQAKIDYDGAVALAQQARYQALETADAAYTAALATPNPTNIAALTVTYGQEWSQTSSTENAQVTLHAAAYLAAVSAAQSQYQAALSAASIAGQQPGGGGAAAYYQALSDATLALAQATDEAQRTWRDADFDSWLEADLSFNAESEAMTQAQVTADAWSAVNFVQATGALDVASADADATYKEALADATRDQADAVAQAAHDRAYANVNAETTLTQAVAADAETATAAWAAVDGSPWGHYQSELAANEAQYVNDEATANATLRHAEADADLAKAQAIAQANDDDETALDAALAQSAVAASNALVTLAVDDAQADLTRNQNATSENQQYLDESQQVEHDASLAYAAAAQVELDAVAAHPTAPQAAEDAYQNAVDSISIAATLSGAQIGHDYTAQLRAQQVACADTQAGDNLASEHALAQAEHDSAVATATAQANFDLANANADREQIVAVAQADQTFGDVEAGFKGVLDLANAQSTQSFQDTVANGYVGQLQAWAQTQGTPWATLQAALVADDAQWTIAMALANVDDVQAMQAPNVAWATANDLAEKTQTIADANAQATAATAGADATLASATAAADAQIAQQNDDSLAAQTFQQATTNETVAKFSAEDDQQLTMLDAQAQATSAADANVANAAWVMAVAGDRSLAIGEQTQSQVAFVQAVGANAVTLAGALGDADVQLATDQAGVAQTLAVAQADDAQALAVAGAQADKTLADAQAAAGQVQTHAQAAAQAQLNLSSSDDSEQYSVAQANDYATATAAAAASAATPQAEYDAAVAAAVAAQAAANAASAGVYEAATTAADVQLSDDEAAAQYAQATIQNAQDLSLATQTAGFAYTQAVDDAGYVDQETVAAADDGRVWLNAVAAAYADFYDQNIQGNAVFVDASYAAGVTEVQTMAQFPADFQAALSAAEAAVAAGVQAADVTAMQALGDSGIAESQSLGAADIALASGVSQAKVDLAQGLADDANTEAADEQAADVQQAQTLDGASVTRSIAMAHAEVNWTTTTTGSATAETSANGLADVAEATSVASAQSNYQVAVATSAAASAASWAQTDGSAQSRFEAAAANAWSDWIADASPAFVADQTADAQTIADYANATAAIGATQQQQAAGEDLTLATTDAQAAQAEQDQMAAADETYALAVTADQGIHDVANATADQTAVVAQAEANRDANVAAAHLRQDAFVAFAVMPPGTNISPFVHWYSLALAQASLARATSADDGSLAWTTSTAQNDATLEIDQAATTQAHDTAAAAAAHTYAYAAAAAQWTHDKNVAAEADAANVADNAAAMTQAQAGAAADGTFAVAQYAKAATVAGTLAATLGTPWANYRAALATAEAAWAVAEAPATLNYQDTLAGDQQTASDSLTAAALTNANSNADAARALAQAQADADQTQAVSDAAASYTQQHADANVTRDYLVATAQASHDYNITENGFPVELAEGVSAATYYAQVVAAGAAFVTATANDQQNYLAGEADAGAALTAANDADQQAAYASVQQARLAATVAGDAASEGYQTAVAGATDTQQANDALAGQSYDTAGSGAYAAKMVALDQANPSPWADQYAAQAAAKAALTAATAHDAAVEQIALAGADQAEAIAEALAGKALVDAQAKAATDLAIADGAADSTLDSALASASAALAPFAPNAGDSLPGPLVPPRSVATPLTTSYTSWEYAPFWGPPTTSWSNLSAAFDPIYDESGLAVMDFGGGRPSYGWPELYGPMAVYGPMSLYGLMSTYDATSLYGPLSYDGVSSAYGPSYPNALMSAYGLMYTYGVNPGGAGIGMFDDDLAGGLRALTSSPSNPHPWWPTQYEIASEFIGPSGAGGVGGAPPFLGETFGPLGYYSWYKAGLGNFSGDSAGGAPTYADLVGIAPVTPNAGVFWIGQDVNAPIGADGPIANTITPGPAPPLTPPTPDDTQHQSLLFAGTPLGALSDDSQPTQDDAGGAVPIVKVAEQTVADGVDTAAAQAAEQEVELSQLKINFSAHIPTAQFMKLVNEPGSGLRAAPDDTESTFLGSVTLGNLGRQEIYILDVETPNGPMKFAFAEFNVNFTDQNLQMSSEAPTYFALVGVFGNAAHDGVSDMAITQYVMGKARAHSLAVVNGTLTFAMHMLPTGAALDALGAAEPPQLRKPDWKEAKLSLAADASLLVGGLGKVWQGTRAGKVLIGTAIAIDGAFAIKSAGQTLKFAADGDWIQAAGSGGETLLRLYGLKVLSKDLAAKELKAAASVVAPRAGRSELGNALSDLGTNPLGRNLNRLEEFGPGAGFSGVYDVPSGKFLAYASGETRLANGGIPQNLVDQLGGHADVNAALTEVLGTASRDRLGFSMVMDDAGNFAVRFNSRTINEVNPNVLNRTVPAGMRQQIVDAITKSTGRRAYSAQ